jgi:hypothetical protein
LAKSRPTAKPKTVILNTKPLKLAPKFSSNIDKPSSTPKNTKDGPPNLKNGIEASTTPTQSQISTISSRTTTVPDADNYYLTIPGFSLCAALYNNARLQGISCLIPLPLMTPPGTSKLPLPLHPIPLQMTTVHLPYIDCLPIPKLRHNLMLLSGLVDEEEFCGDLVGTTSFVIMGSQSWDPEGWVLEEGFKEKWRFLFD